MVTMMMEHSTDTGVERRTRKGPWDGFSGHDDDDAGVLYLATFIESRILSEHDFRFAFAAP